MSVQEEKRTARLEQDEPLKAILAIKDERATTIESIFTNANR